MGEYLPITLCGYGKALTRICGFAIQRRSHSGEDAMPGDRIRDEKELGNAIEQLSTTIELLDVHLEHLQSEYRQAGLAKAYRDSVDEIRNTVQYTLRTLCEKIKEVISRDGPTAYHNG
jgi:hypothetical protein